MGILSNDLERNDIMESKVQKDIPIEKSMSEGGEIEIRSEVNANNLSNNNCEVKNGNEMPSSTSVGETKIQLSFSVDRLLSTGDVSKEVAESNSTTFEFEKCCEQKNFSCCTQPNCLVGNCADRSYQRTLYQNSSLHPNETVNRIYPGAVPLSAATSHFLDYTSKCVVRPLALRALSGNNCDTAPHCLSFPSLTATSLLRLHQHPSKQTFPHPHTIPYTPTANLTLSPLLVTPLTCNLKSLQLNSHPTATQQQPQHHHQQFRQSPTSPSHFTKTKLPTSPIDISLAGSSAVGGVGGVGHYHPALHQMHPSLTHSHHHQAMLTHLQLGNTNSTGVNNNATNNSTTCNTNNNINSNSSNSNNNNNNSNSNNHSSNGKRKRSWSRAVFSNLQRKGLEIQFQQQKYITKPDRRKLAARLNLTDAQVKVWFQNRRMKWRHTRENLKSGQEKQPTLLAVPGASDQKVQLAEDMQRELGYSSDGSDSSMAISDNEDDGEIDVVE